MHRQSIFKPESIRRQLKYQELRNHGGDFGNSNFQKKVSKFFKKLLMSFHNLFPHLVRWKQTFFNTENISFRCNGN
jgi:hypothetical protein